MSEQTNIEWATSTGNPWIGCTKVSPGCKNCYAAQMDEKRFSKTMGGSHWGKGSPRVRTKGFWKDALRWNKVAANQFPTGAPFRPRIFPSLCDWLDEEVPIEWLADFLKLIHDTPNLDWLLLTKRPENFNKRLDESGKRLWNTRYAQEPFSMVSNWIEADKPPANVWLGVSVEDQARADERLPLLASIPARVRFASFEPLLEYIDPRIPVLKQATQGVGPVLGLDWAIIGGESGRERRDCGVEAICDLADTLSFTNGIPTFVKQDCAFKPGQKGRIPDAIWALKQFPK